MKLVVLSDIHGNLPALQAVLEDISQWQPDEVVVNGDLLNRGPYSPHVLQYLASERPSARLLRGNHENWLLYAAAQGADPESATYEIDRMVFWTLSQLGKQLEAVRNWEDHLDLMDGEGASLHITHGSRLGDRKGIQPDCGVDELQHKLGDPRDLFVASHTHRAFTREFEGRLVINTGSVGQPFDGDERASYARLWFLDGRWHGEIRRVPYHREQAIRDFSESGFLEQAGALSGLIFKEFFEARMHVGPWRRAWLEAVKAREIGVAESVQRYLDNL